jgi:hypothetical protein
MTTSISCPADLRCGSFLVTKDRITNQKSQAVAKKLDEDITIGGMIVDFGPSGIAVSK